MSVNANMDPSSLSHFGARASRWWDERGEFKTLHHINPLRLEFVNRHAKVRDAKIADLGCGGGILSEALAKAGGKVIGIDLSEPLLEVARLHGMESGVKVEYRNISAESLATEAAEQYDIVTVMELLEHVPNPQALVTACAQLLRPGGMAFFSTINRTPMAYLKAILAAEYVLNLVPRGTHDYKQFIKPSKLDQWARGAGLKVVETKGFDYCPITEKATFTSRVDTNFLTCYRKLP